MLSFIRYILNQIRSKSYFLICLTLIGIIFIQSSQINENPIKNVQDYLRNHKFSSRLNSNGQSDFNSNSQNRLKPNVQSDFNLNSHSRLKPNVQSDFNSNSQNRLKPNVQSDFSSNSQKRLKPNVQSDFNSNSKNDLNAQIVETTTISIISSTATKSQNQSVEETQNSAANVKFFDLSKPLEPESKYQRIKCRKSARVAATQTKLCVHDIDKDVHVSGAIWNTGVWEDGILTAFLRHIEYSPNSLVIDIGAQIGQYSLFAAKMGRKVLTVEPFYENILRIHKAAKEEGISDNIILVQNALSDKRNEIKRLQPASNNIGGQSLIESKNKVFQKKDMENDVYLVETVLLNDLTKFLPLNNLGLKYDSAILKLDIEGFEPFMFQHADKFFDAIKIKIIFMEWGNLPKQRDEKFKIEQMIDFLSDRKFTPFGNGRALEKSKWMQWPWDIEWRQTVNGDKLQPANARRSARRI